MLTVAFGVLLAISVAALLLTRLKNAETVKSLKAQSARDKDRIFWLESILDAVNSPITVTNADMEWTFVNKAVEKFLGVEREEILGKKCRNWGANICDTENCGITRLRNGHKETYFQQFGGEYHVLVSYLYDEKNVLAGHVEVVYEDTAVIAREKKKFEALAHWYESILDAIPFLISVTDMDMKWSFINAALERYTGIRRKDAIGKPCSGCGFGICDTGDCSIARARQGAMQTYFKQGETSFQADAAILKGINGETAGYLTLLQDVTAFERMTKQHVEAEAASMAKSSFLAHISHEMRTPLNAITGMTALGMSAPGLERKDYCFAKIHDASNHLLGVINDVLDMSKIEANKFELSPVTFDFEKMLLRVVDIVNFRVDEKRQTLIVKIDRDVPRLIIADDQRLAQVVTNLLGNAVKFTPEQGNITVAASLEREDGDICALRVSVSDTGIGLSAEQRKKLFASFQQADSSTARKYGGTGLGLAISKNIVEMMGGNISVESEPGVGSTFSFTVPVKRAPAGAESAEGALGAVPGRTLEEAAELLAGRSILLVEDVEINREIVLSLLEPTRLRIDCAENGEEAVRMFAAAPDKYDLIFMDVQMPGMDGYEATRQIRAMGTEAAKGVPIVAMTANVFREDIEKCLEAGMNSHIGKPIGLDEVLDRLFTYMPK
jgi:signal transduction histidine kinase